MWPYLSIYYDMFATSRDHKHPPFRQSRLHTIECSQEWLLTVPREEGRPNSPLHMCALGPWKEEMVDEIKYWDPVFYLFWNTFHPQKWFSSQFKIILSENLKGWWVGEGIRILYQNIYIPLNKSWTLTWEHVQAPPFHSPP